MFGNSILNNAKYSSNTDDVAEQMIRVFEDVVNHRDTYVYHR